MSVSDHERTIGSLRLDVAELTKQRDEYKQKVSDMEWEYAQLAKDYDELRKKLKREEPEA